MPDYCATSLRNNISQLLFGNTYELGIGGKQASASGCGNFLNNVKSFLPLLRQSAGVF